MKSTLIILITIIQLYSNNEFIQNCQVCHGDSPGKEPLLLSNIKKDFLNYEFLDYLKYEKDKFSLHNYIINNKKYNNKIKDKIIKSSNLSYKIRLNITNYIFNQEDNSNACMW